MMTLCPLSSGNCGRPIDCREASQRSLLGASIKVEPEPDFCSIDGCGKERRSGAHFSSQFDQMVRLELGPKIDQKSSRSSKLWTLKGAKS